MKIYSIRNTMIGYSNRPFYFETDEEAMQYILNVLCSDADRSLSNLKDCLILDCLGEIDFSAGVITSTEKYTVIDLDEIWVKVPLEKVPRDSNELRTLISEEGKKVAALSNKIDKVCDCLATHFKFIRKVIN